MGEPSGPFRLMPWGHRAPFLLAGVIGVVGCQHRPMADPAAAMPSARLLVHLPDPGGQKGRSVTIWLARPLGSPTPPPVGGREALLEQLRLSLDRVSGS